MAFLRKRGQACYTRLNTPPGPTNARPTIVCVAASLFLVVSIGKSLRIMAGQGGGK